MAMLQVVACKASSSRHSNGEFSLFDDEKQELVEGHILNGLWSHSVDLTAYAIIFNLGVDAEFDEVVADSWLGQTIGCRRFLRSRDLG
jgi:hypothetical protein